MRNDLGLHFFRTLNRQAVAGFHGGDQFGGLPADGIGRGEGNGSAGFQGLAHGLQVTKLGEAGGECFQLRGALHPLFHRGKIEVGCDTGADAEYQGQEEKQGFHGRGGRRKTKVPWP